MYTPLTNPIQPTYITYLKFNPYSQNLERTNKLDVSSVDESYTSFIRKSSYKNSFV